MIIDISEWNPDYGWYSLTNLTKVWCDFHCEGRWHRTYGEMFFELESDAMMFILRWHNVSNNDI